MTTTPNPSNHHHPDPDRPAQPATGPVPREGADARPSARAGGDGRPFMFPGLEGTVVDRRMGIDRRMTQDKLTGLDRRRGAGRRRSDFLKAADEGELNREQFMFLMAVQAFKKANQTMFPTWTDVLEVIRLLGYRKTMPSELNLPNAEDWREAPDAPANVRTINGKTIRRAA